MPLQRRGAVEKRLGKKAEVFIQVLLGTCGSRKVRFRY